MPNIRLKPTLKNPAIGTALSAARICLNGQSQLKKSILTTTPASFNGLVVEALK